MNYFIDMRQKCDVLYNNYKKTNNKKYIEDIWLLTNEYVIGYMYKKFSTFCYLDLEYGDFISLSYISLIKSLKEANCQNGFLYFYFNNLKWVCSNYVRKFISNKHKILNINYFLNKEDIMDENNLSDMEDYLCDETSIEHNIKREEYFNILRSIIFKAIEDKRKFFSRLEVDILKNLMDGESLEYIAKKNKISLEEASISYRKVRQKIKRFVSFYKKFLDDDNFNYGSKNIDVNINNFI